MNKKGIGAIFAWIFIMIAGALIITVFTIIAMDSSASAQDRLNLQALENVNTILQTQQTTGNIATNINIPYTNLRITCSAFEGGGSIALENQLEIGGFSQDLETQLVAGRDLTTDRLSLFSKRWSAPYTVGNILYVTSPDEILLYSQPTHMNTEFSELVPEGLNVHDEIMTGLRPEAYENSRIVIIETSPAPDVTGYISKINTVQEGVQYMHVHSRGNNFEKGSVTYYELDNTNTLRRSDSYLYHGPEMMLAYVWQADSTRANCMQHKLAERLKAQTEVQLSRVQNLRTHYTLNSACGQRHSSDPLIRLQEALEPNLPFDNQKVLYGFSDLSEAIEGVHAHNERLLRGDRCASIY